MKSWWFIPLLLCCSLAKAQQTGESAPVSPLLKGKEVVEQLQAALDASAYLNSWTADAQSAWSKELGEANDAAALARCVSDLAEYIKPSKFNEQFSLAHLRSLTSLTKNYGDVAHAITALEAGLTTEAFTTDWVSQRPSWQSELSLVK